jgi:hypothetical protein
VESDGRNIMTDPKKSGPPKGPLKRISIIIIIGLFLLAGAHIYRNSRRPIEVAREFAEKGLDEVRAIIETIKASEFGKSKRGAALTEEAEKLLARDAIRFSAGLDKEALLRKEAGSRPVLYIRVFAIADSVVLPAQSELAECLYHEGLHAAQRSEGRSWEEECDAFCAAEEARAVVEDRAPRFPVERDGQIIWEWVTATYTELFSNPEYQPVGQTQAELNSRAGIPAR